MAGFDGLGLFPIEIDVYKKHKVSTINAHEDDANGRGLLVTLLKDGVPFDTTGIALKLAFRNAIGEERMFDFTATDLTTGKYTVKYPREMLDGNGGRVVQTEVKAYDIATQAMISYSPLNVYVSKAVVTEGELIGNSEGSTFVQLLERVETVETGLGNLDPVHVANVVTLADNIVPVENARVAAESSRATAESGRVTAESNRAIAETSRATAEGNRLIAESSRGTAETGRVNAESSRVTTESARVTAEGSRVTAENARVSAETGRNNNEVARQNAESLRVTAETSRGNAESARGANEAARILAEDAREDAEASRAAAESTRVSSETERGTAESGRVSAELSRASAENSRATAESGRASAESSRVSAETSRVNAENARASFYDGFNAQLAEIETDIIDLQSRAIRQHGARRTLNATSPLLERIFDAAGKVANVPTDDGAAVNDFDNIFPWSHIRECKRDTTGRIHYKGDPGYDLLTNVDWLIEIPKFYIRMQRTATTFDRVISEIKRAGFWVPSVFKRADGTECDKIYVGRFKTGIVDGVDVSRPGIFPENFRDLASFRTGARAKGAGWQLIDISYKTEVLDMLYIIESATLNSQVYLGNGITTVRYVATDLAQIAETAVNRIVVTNAMAGNYNVGENICIGTAQGSENIARDRTILSKAALPDGINTEIVFDGDPVNIAVGNVLWQGAQKNGQTMNLQKPNGKLSGVSGRTSNKYRGMEDIFGNVFEWVDGVLISERIAQICKDPAKYASTLTADYKPVGYTNLATDGYPLEMGFDSNYPEAIFPTTTGGGTSTGYCDYYYQNTGLRGASFGGGASNGVNAGVFYWVLNYTPTVAHWTIGSRLLFKPPV